MKLSKVNPGKKFLMCGDVYLMIDKHPQIKIMSDDTEADLYYISEKSRMYCFSYQRDGEVPEVQLVDDKGKVISEVIIIRYRWEYKSDMGEWEYKELPKDTTTEQIKAWATIQEAGMRPILKWEYV